MPDKNPVENPSLAAFRKKKRPKVNRDTSLSAQNEPAAEPVVDNLTPIPATQAIPVEPAAPAPKETRTKQAKPATAVVIKAPTLPKQMDELITVGQRRNIRLEEKLDTEIEQFVRDKKLSIEILLEALYLIAKDDKELMDKTLTLGNERMQERKEAGKLRRIYVQMQKYK
ncbi:hypothetical protein [Leptothoe sp. PORK10 BA2]|uniref:hypothetical protein n=1 Tax=Leptothoe sp. PORK10 BA2 TaxID=3110254 RepID=UPI002B1F9265|nr:hypothetical protein [Leptothoe sp. PORK10 BA2]MEA5464913.1 hypothetical protein [Leptothoe sp. PORK10 BA2]